MTVRTNNPTKVPSVLTVPAGVSPELRRYLDQLTETIEIRLGRRGDQRDRAVTLRELIDSGLAQDLLSNPFDPNTSGNTGFAQSGSFLQDLAVPPAPTGFTAVGAFSQVILNWDYPSYANHSFTEVWRHDSDSVGDAQLIGVQAGRVFVDPVGSGVTRYYWVRHVNTDSIAGPFNSASGTVATTAVDVNHMLTLLSNAITSSQLAQDLSTPIGNLPTNTTSAIAAVQASVDAVKTGFEDWDSTKAYQVNDVVKESTSSTKLYLCVLAVSANSGIALTNTSYWKLYGDYDSLESSTVASTAAISEINTVNSSSTSASALAINGLNASVYVNGDPNQGLTLATSSALSAVQTEVFPNGTASASRLDTLDAEVFDASGNSLLATASALGTVTTEVFPNGTSNASRIDALDNILFDPSTTPPTARVSASNLTKMKNQILDINGNATATATQMTQLAASFTDPQGSTNTLSLQQALETSASEVDGLRGQYSVKIDNNGHVSGFGFNSTAVNGTPRSAFIVRADTFAIVDPQSTGNGLGTTSPTADTVPFIYHDGTGTLNGETVPAGVYMKRTFIGEAQIESAQIKFVAADKIETGFLGSDVIEANSIEGSKLKIDSNYLTVDANDQLQLVTSNGSNGIKIENLSEDAVGTIHFANQPFVAAANAFVSGFTSYHPTFAQFIASTPYYSGPTTLPQLLQTTIHKDKIKETGDYQVDFGGVVIGSSATGGACAIVAEIEDSPNNSTWTSRYHVHTNDYSGQSHILANLFSYSSFALSANKYLRITLYGYKIYVNNNANGQNGFGNLFVRVFRIAKNT